jgi:regulator of protease activity HflC (stomatin/prohibitin superfamily)
MMMLGIKKIEIADHQKALLFRNNSFQKILQPGRHYFVDLFNVLRIDVHDCEQSEFQHRLAKFLLRTYPQLKQDYLDEYELGDNEVGLCHIDGKLVDILPPGTHHAYWKKPAEVRVERLDISTNYRVAEETLSLLAHSILFRQSQAALHAIYYVEVADYSVGLLLINGHKEALLPPGNYGFWRYNRNITLKYLDLRLQSMEVSGQEMLTRDRVSLRINLSAAYRVIDVEKAAMELVDYAEFLYRELQLALREAVSSKTLDELLADKNALNQDIHHAVSAHATHHGLNLGTVGVKDIILPGDMKTILNQVVEAEKAAEANLVRRREETAATRSLHNTAKVMEGNPTLLRLKELEVLEKISDRIDQITVYDGLEGIMNNLVNIPVNARQNVP